MEQRGLRGRAFPVAALVSQIAFQKCTFVELYRGTPEILLDNVRMVVGFRLNQGAKEQREIGIHHLDRLDKGRIPSGCSDHIVVHVQHPIVVSLRHRMIHCQTHSNIPGALRVFDTLRFDPIQRAIRTIIEMHDDLMVECRVLLQTLHAQFQVRKVVPAGDNDTDHFTASHAM